MRYNNILGGTHLAEVLGGDLDTLTCLVKRFFCRLFLFTLAYVFLFTLEENNAASHSLCTKDAVLVFLVGYIYGAGAVIFHRLELSRAP